MRRAFARHPLIFPNSAGQFPLPAPAYDPPVPPVGGLFGGIGRKLAASVNGPGIGYGLFGSPLRLPAANTDAPPSMLGTGSDPAPSSISCCISAGSGAALLPADPTTPPKSIALSIVFAHRPRLPPALSRLALRIPFSHSASARKRAATPTRSVLLNQSTSRLGPRARPIGTPQTSIKTTRPWRLTLPTSKSGAPVVSPPPCSRTTSARVDVAHLLSPIRRLFHQDASRPGAAVALNAGQAS